MLIRNGLSRATGRYEAIEDGITTVFEPAVKAIREIGQISVQLFARHMGMGFSNPGFQPCHDAMNIGEDLNRPLTFPIGEGQ